MGQQLIEKLDRKPSNGAKGLSPKQSNALSPDRTRRAPIETIDEKRHRIALSRMRLYEPEKFAKLAEIEAAKNSPPPPPPTKAADLPELTPYGERLLWAKVQKGAADECWPWTGARSKFGHGRVKLAGKLYLPHRLIYALTYGPIDNVRQPHGTVVRHTCDNPGCCNPAHLQLGTQKDNVADMHARGRAHQNLPPVEHRFGSPARLAPRMAGGV